MDPSRLCHVIFAPSLLHWRFAIHSFIHNWNRQMHWYIFIPSLDQILDLLWRSFLLTVVYYHKAFISDQTIFTQSNWTYAECFVQTISHPFHFFTVNEALDHFRIKEPFVSLAQRSAWALDSCHFMLIHHYVSSLRAGQNFIDLWHLFFHSLSSDCYQHYVMALYF